MSVLTADNRFEEIQNEEGEVRNMCEVLDRVEARGMFNDLNVGKNEELLSKCKSLTDYMALVNRIKSRNQKSKMLFEEAVDEAVSSCIKDGIMAEYLSKHREDVMSSCITEFDEEEFIEGIIEESYIEGQRQQLIELVKDGLLKITDAANKAGMTMAEFEALLQQQTAK